MREPPHQSPQAPQVLISSKQKSLRKWLFGRSETPAMGRDEMNGLRGLAESLEGNGLIMAAQAERCRTRSQFAFFRIRAISSFFKPSPVFLLNVDDINGLPRVNTIAAVPIIHSPDFAAFNACGPNTCFMYDLTRMRGELHHGCYAVEPDTERAICR